MSTGVARTVVKPGPGGGTDTTTRIAALTPEERQALQARILARREQQTKSTSPSPSSPSTTSTLGARPPATSASATNATSPSSVANRSTTVSSRIGQSQPQTQPQTQTLTPSTNVHTSSATPTNSTASTNPAVQNALNRTRVLGSRGASSNNLPVQPTTSQPSSSNPSPATNPSRISGEGAHGSSLRTLPTRRGLEPIQRRPSIQVIEKEKKTDYWKDVAQAAQTSSASGIGNEDLNTVISRAMSLGIVGDRNQRKSLSAPKAQDVLTQVCQSMEKRILELSGKLPDTSSLGIMEKITQLEKTLSVLEANKSKLEEEEKLRVQTKIVELESSLKNLEAQKNQQREQNRQTMKFEIDKLKEMMAKVQEQQNPSAETAAKDMASKMARLEAALRIMNEERKKESGDDKETVVLKRKLQLFEQKLKEMEDEKKLREEADNSAALREKLLSMEDKLAKMERRKSVTASQEMQLKMEAVEKQLVMLRTERNNGHPDNVNTKIAQKMQLLERQLKDMAAQKIVVNDPETIALRNHISKLEDTILAAEKRLEGQRNKMEEERKRIYEQKKIDDDEFRKQAAEKEKELMKRLEMMEDMMKKGATANFDPALLGKLSSANNDQISQRMAEMEKKILETQKALEDEKTKNAMLTTTGVNTIASGGDVGDPFAVLARAQADLAEKLKTTQDIMNKKMEELSKMQFVGGGGGGSVSKSGLSYKEINDKLAEIQGKLFSGEIDERESETLNIEYEKLITELESTDEYKKEQEEIRNKWKRENEAPNKEAFDKVTAFLKSMDDQKLTAAFKRKPELRFLLKTPDQLLKAHVNDFKQVSTQNLNLLESRALYHIMPVFRKDQEQQAQFVVQLQTKIEQEMVKPVAAPPPIKSTKKVVIKKPKAGGGGGGGGGGAGFLDELLAKRKRKE